MECFIDYCFQFFATTWCLNLHYRKHSHLKVYFGFKNFFLNLIFYFYEFL